MASEMIWTSSCRGTCTKAARGRRLPNPDGFLRPPEVGQKDQGLAVNLLQNQSAAGEHLGDGLLDRSFLHPEQLRRRKLQLLQREGAVTVRGRLQQHVVNARLCPVEGVARNPDPLGDLVGGGEADPAEFG